MCALVRMRVCECSFVGGVRVRACVRACVLKSVKVSGLKRNVLVVDVLENIKKVCVFL